MERREFIKTSTMATSALALAPFAETSKCNIAPVNLLPRWRGFNLLEKFSTDRPEWSTSYNEKDFELMQEWGFDFARLPMSYLCWMTQDDWMKHDTPLISNEKGIDDIDQVINFGKQYNVHVQLNMHRIQGYCVSQDFIEPLNIWKDRKALDAAIWQWRFFAKRYKGISNENLSFDLINEPAGIEPETYVRVVTEIVQAIREDDPQRLIIADGLEYGTRPVFGLKDLNIGQSTRGYSPPELSHYKTSPAVKSTTVPTWPMMIDGIRWDKDKLYRDYIQPWQKLQAQGVGIHIGEWGCFKYTPHEVCLKWMRSWLSLWKQAGWGWALWNLRGHFGIIDSKREDIVYENYKGLLLDRKMLLTLQRHG